MNLNVTDPKGQRDLARLKGSFAFDKILSSTARHFKTDADEMLRKSSRCEARKALMAELLSGTYQTPLGEIRFTPEGEVIQKDFFVAQVRMDASGKSGRFALLP